MKPAAKSDCEPLSTNAARCTKGWIAGGHVICGGLSFTIVGREIIAVSGSD
jgi:hypothetical protein